MIFTVIDIVFLQSKAWDYDHSLPGIVGSNPAEGIDVCFL